MGQIIWKWAVPLEIQSIYKVEKEQTGLAEPVLEILEDATSLAPQSTGVSGILRSDARIQ